MKFPHFLAAIVLFLANIGKIHTQIIPESDTPPAIVAIFESGEFFDPKCELPQAVAALRTAQKAYVDLGRLAEAVDLYAHILVIGTDIDTSSWVDSIGLYAQMYEKELLKLPKSAQPAAYRKAYASLFYYTGKEHYQQKYLSVADTVDWEAIFVYTMACYYNTNMDEPTAQAQMLQIYKHINPQKITLKGKKPSLVRYDYLFYLQLVSQANNELKRDRNLAIAISEQGLQMCEAITPFAKEEKSLFLNNIGSLYFEKGDFQKAIHYIQKAKLNLLEIKKNEEIEFTYDMNTGISFFKMEDYPNAIRYLKKVVAAEEKSEEFVTDLYVSYYYLAFAHFFIGKGEEAERYALLLDAYYPKMPANNKFKPYVGVLRGYVMGAYHEKNKNWEKAISFYTQSVRFKTPYVLIQSKCFSGIARVHIHQAQYAKAYIFAEKALGNLLLSKSFNLAGLNAIPFDKVIYKKDALEYIRQILSILRAQNPNTDLQSLRKYQKISDYGVGLLELTLKELEREGSQYNILKLSYPIYEHAINAAYHLHQLTGEKAYLDTAFKYMEDSKSILLSQTLAEKRAQGFAGVDAKLIEMERTLTKDIQFYTQQARDAKTRKDEAAERLCQGYIFDFGLRLDSLKKRLNIEYPSYYALKYQIPPIAIAAVQKQLNDSSLFIEYFEGQEVYFAIGISQNAYKLVKIPTGKAEKELIHTFNNSVQSHQIKKSPQELQEMGNRIYKLLLDSLLSDTRIFTNAGKIQRLVLIPDGKLNYLPFEALVSDPLPSAEKPTFARLPYLLHQYIHNYQYSARLWLQMASKKPQTIARILGFAAYYPNQDSLQLAKLTLQAQRIRKNLNPLKGALQEVAHLRANYAGNYYLEATATEKQLRQSLQSTEKYQILHLAMHGLVNEETPEWSCLGFSPSADSLEDDLLQAHEIKALQMNQGEGVDMVVLSACETGLGKYQHGEGVISLGRGFVYGGANSLVMSLWSVNDDASAFLMEKFYGHLAAGMEKDAALRQAKLDYLQAAQGQDLACHPALWAAFVQLGNIQPLSIETSRKYLPLRVYALLGLGLSLVGLGYWRWRKYRLQAAS